MMTPLLQKMKHPVALSISDKNVHSFNPDILTLWLLCRENILNSFLQGSLVEELISVPNSVKLCFWILVLNILCSFGFHFEIL